MASRIVALGLEEAGKVIAALSTRTNRSMSWDTSTGAAAAFTSAHTALNSPGAVVAMIVNATTNTTVGAQTVQYEGTLTTAQLNGQNIGRIAIHFDTTVNVTTASATLYGGIDQQTIQKTSEYSLVTRLQVQQITT